MCQSVSMFLKLIRASVVGREEIQQRKEIIFTFRFFWSIQNDSVLKLYCKWFHFKAGFSTYHTSFSICDLLLVSMNDPVVTERLCSLSPCPVLTGVWNKSQATLAHSSDHFLVQWDNSDQQTLKSMPVCILSNSARRLHQTAHWLMNSMLD